MTLSDFSQLKQQFIRIFVSSDRHFDQLHTLKELFRESINSVRRFEKITTIGELLKVLELRGILTEDCVEPLKGIAKKINSNELLSEVNKYEDNHIPREYDNYYVPERDPSSLRLNKTWPSGPEPPNSNSCSNPLIISQKKKERMVRTVVEEIGTFWRDLARRLRVRECEIEDIDSSNKSMATKALKMMQRYDARVNQQKWYFDLCDALDLIHRRDIGHSLREVMMMNI